MSFTSRFSTRRLLSTAAIGAAGGLLTVGLNYALVGLPPSSLTYAVYAATIPAWSLGAFVATALFRRPGIALLTSVFAGVINLVSPFGVAQLVNFLVIGLLLELPFAVARYRRWDDRYLWFALPTGALLLSAGYLASCLVTGAIVPSALAPWLSALLVVLTVGLALGLTALSLRTAAGLRRAGIAGRPGVVGPAASPGWDDDATHGRDDDATHEPDGDATARSEERPSR